ncbi:mechanosensitive ion channel family protein [Jannaschia formosa]|uniref:mechanosensitive ion channel family protein n=1 Tax=Jannaschia formosa TaxID=2259592 RepID=UPI000E1C2F4A|nr:mechanosensitive ion channel family protein [Jannaschia formosa]TFL17361.1 mechanosensitive ion channel family protein [Jannaschia formosa]
MDQETDADPGTDQPIEAEPELALEKVDTWLDGFFAMLPNIGVALVVLAVFVAIGLGVAWSLRTSFGRRDREDLGTVLASMAKWALWIAGAVLAMTIVTPSLRPGDLIAGLGLGSVAIGFAFKDILQNMLAGLLILIRQPFRVHDQIVAGDYEGTVEHIETRATLLKTYDGRRVVIPNSDVYTSAVTVNTAWDIRRSEYDFGIDYAADTARAMRVALDAVNRVDGVRDDPEPEALSLDLGDFRKTVRLRWWTASTQRARLHVYSDVMLAVERAFAEHDIGIPFPIRTLHLPAGSEERDGHRLAAR